MSSTARRILVVDDDADTAQSFAAVLRMLGHSAEFTSDPGAVVEMATRMKPDVVLLDIGMPGMDGFQLAKLLRQRFSGTYVVAITGHGTDEYRKRGREAGFDAYVVKPVDPPLLESILKTLFDPRPPR